MRFSSVAYFLISAVIVLPPQLLWSQSYKIKLICYNCPKEMNPTKYKESHNSPSNAQNELSRVMNYFYASGFLQANIDSINSPDSLTKIYYVNAGNKYKWVRLKKSSLDTEVLSRTGFYEKMYAGKPFNYRQLSRLIEKVITYYENNGYPFASVKLDSINIEDKTVSAVLKINKNKLFKIDSVLVSGDIKINKTFLFRYLNIKPLSLYNEAAFKSISSKLKQLPFVSETRPQVVKLSDKSNKLYLFLNKKNASQFDGIIGILPDNSGKTIFTGDVKIKLINNIFRSGETVDVNWRRLQSQTQDFKGRVIYPYLFGSPLGTDYALKIYRRDSSFIDVNNNFGFQYYFSGLNNLKIYYKQRNANILSASGLEFLTVLPDYADIVTQSYGLGFNLEKLNYRFNPHKGVSLNINTQVGNKSIKKNSKINNDLYNHILLKSVQYQIEGDLNVYLQLKGNHVLRFGTQYASVFGNSVLFKNELFRIGGLKTLRGFDEESIFASSYLIPTVEYRFLFGQNSNILLFAEGAWYENNAGAIYIKDIPYSVGAGINFDTKAGIFTLNYAIGSQFGNPLDVRIGKIHFGLTALF